MVRRGRRTRLTRAPVVDPKDNPQEQCLLLTRKQAAFGEGGVLGALTRATDMRPVTSPADNTSSLALEGQPNIAQVEGLGCGTTPLRRAL